MNLLQAMNDERLLAPWFRHPESWTAWRSFVAALFGLPLTEQQAGLFRQCTGREELPTDQAQEAWLICGRRSGKSFILALLAVYLACFKRYQVHLAPGERATVLVLATDRKQARIIFRYARSMLKEVPMLARMVERETADSFDLSNSVTIEVGTASYRSTRGYSFAAVLCDEIAFWPHDDSAEPDYAVLDAIRPGLSTIAGSMLLCASSPYSRRGAMFDAFRRWWGQDGRELVWRAPTRTMNPTIPQGIIDRAMERDPASAAAEWLAEFRSDVESFVSREAVEAVVSPDVRERAPVAGVRYQAFVDPSGGVSDSMTLAIGHRDGGVALLDALREVRPPFSPESAVRDFCALLKRYDVTTVQGDRYAGEWPREGFRNHGVRYEPSAKPKSDLYRDLLPRLNSGEVDLLDDGRLVAQLCGLERRTSRSGRDSIDHAPGGHDDLANAAAGVLVGVLDGYSRGEVSVRFVTGMY